MAPHIKTPQTFAGMLMALCLLPVLLRPTLNTLLNFLSHVAPYAIGGVLLYVFARVAVAMAKRW